MWSRSSGVRALRDVQPSSLKQPPKPSIFWAGLARSTAKSRLSQCHAGLGNDVVCQGVDSVVVIQVALVAWAWRARGRMAPVESMAACWRSARRVIGLDIRFEG